MQNALNEIDKYYKNKKAKIYIRNIPIFQLQSNC